MSDTVYPTSIRFDLIKPALRDRVLAAAARLGLPVTHDGPIEFYVGVRDEKEAYALGRECGEIRA